MRSLNYGFNVFITTNACKDNESREGGESRFSARSFKVLPESLSEVMMM